MIQDLKQLARRYPRFGYRRLHQMLLRQSPDGPPINVKRVRRLCTLAGLKLPVKRRKKRRGIGVKQPVIAAYPNHVWAYDFLHDWCPSGRQLKILTVEDEFTRESLAIEVDYRITARQLCGILQGLMQRRGVPAFVRLRTMARNSWPGRCGGCWRSKGRRASTSIRAARGKTAGEERFNGIFRDECANMETFHHRDHARALCRLFQKYYNSERPHSSLGYQTPEEFARRHPHWVQAALSLIRISPRLHPMGGAAMTCRGSPWRTMTECRYEICLCV